MQATTVERCRGVRRRGLTLCGRPATALYAAVDGFRAPLCGGHQRSSWARMMGLRFLRRLPEGR